MTVSSEKLTGIFNLRTLIEISRYVAIVEFRWNQVGAVDTSVPFIRDGETGIRSERSEPDSLSEC